jgi:hypothetical protein
VKTAYSGPYYSCATSCDQFRRTGLRRSRSRLPGLSKGLLPHLKRLWICHLLRSLLALGLRAHRPVVRHVLPTVPALPRPQPTAPLAQVPEDQGADPKFLQHCDGSRLGLLRRLLARAALHPPSQAAPSTLLLAPTGSGQGLMIALHRGQEHSLVASTCVLAGRFRFAEDLDSAERPLITLGRARPASPAPFSPGSKAKIPIWKLCRLVRCGA